MGNALVLFAYQIVMEKIVARLIIVINHVKKVLVQNQDTHVLVENVLAYPTVMEKIVVRLIIVIIHAKKVLVQNQDTHVLVENVIQIFLILVIIRMKILLETLQEHVVKIDYNVAIIYNSVLTKTLIIMFVEIINLKLIFVKEIQVLNILIVKKYQIVKEVQVLIFVLVIKKMKILLETLQEHVLKIDYNVAMIYNSVLTRKLIVMSVEIRNLKLIFVKEIQVLNILIVKKYQIVKEVVNFVLKAQHIELTLKR
jgi:hypothetical protein